MDLDPKIRTELETAASGARMSADAWTDIERRIERSRRRRAATVALAIVVGLGVAALSYSVIDRRQVPVTGDDGTISPRSGSFRLTPATDWSGRANDDLSVTITPPGPPKNADGSTAFTIEASLGAIKYDQVGMDPSYRLEGSNGFSSSQTDVEVAGRQAIRIDVAPYDGQDPSPPRASPETAGLIIYRIDWPGTAPQCESAKPCTLYIELKASSTELMQRYRAVAQQIVMSVEVVPAKPLPGISGVQAKISLKAGTLAAGAGGLWAFSAPDNDYHLDHLYRIDPDTNALNGSVEVGYLPTALAADDSAVWVVNRRACDEITDCADSEHPGSTDLPGPPTQSCVTRIDPRTLRVTAVIELRNPRAVALGDGAVWVVDWPSNGKADLVRIDPVTNTIQKRIPFSGGFQEPRIAVRGGSVWVTAGGKLHRLDPQSNELTATYDVGGSMISPQPTGTSLWMVGGTNSEWAFLKVDTESGGVVATYPSSRVYPTAGGGHSIWTVGGGGSFREFDIESGKFSDATYFGGEPGAYGMTTGFGSVWVALDDGKIWRIAQ